MGNSGEKEQKVFKELPPEDDIVIDQPLETSKTLAKVIELKIKQEENKPKYHQYILHRGQYLQIDRLIKKGEEISLKQAKNLFNYGPSQKSIKQLENYIQQKQDTKAFYALDLHLPFNGLYKNNQELEIFDKITGQEMITSLIINIQSRYKLGDDFAKVVNTVLTKQIQLKCL